MTNTNNYYSYDSHNVTTTTTNNYSSTDSHNTTTTTNNYSWVDSHDTTTNVSLVSGGVLNGSLNNILSGNTLVNVGDVLSGNTVGDVLSHNTILSPTLNVGDVTLGISDLVHDALNPSVLNNLNVGGILSPDITGGLLNGANILNVTDVGNVAANLLPIAGSVLSNVDIADLSHLTSSIAPSVGDILPVAIGELSHIADGNLTNVNIPIVSDLLSGNATNVLGNVAPSVTDVLGHVVSADLSGQTTNLPVVADILNDVGNGNLDHVTANVASSIGDVLSHIGGGDFSGVTAIVPANIAAPVTGIVGDIGNGAIGANVMPVANDVLSHIADAGLANGSIGDIVAHIASIGGGDITAPLNISDVVHNVGAGLTGDLVHNLGSVDLSDVGAVLNSQPLHDVTAANLDLDHLTSKVNLFDLGHLDLAHDLIHHG